VAMVAMATVAGGRACACESRVEMAVAPAGSGRRGEEVMAR
jgi:hypothetical protein